MKKLLLAIILGTMAYSTNSSAASPTGEYNAVIAYTVEQAITFPDFTLRFTGKTAGGTLPSGVPMGERHHFTISANGNAQQIDWSSGTGEITGRRFTIGEKTFLLELKMSEQLNKQLQVDQLVITPFKP